MTIIRQGKGYLGVVNETTGYFPLIRYRKPQTNPLRVGPEHPRITFQQL